MLSLLGLGLEVEGLTGFLNSPDTDLRVFFPMLSVPNLVTHGERVLAEGYLDKGEPFG